VRTLRAIRAVLPPGEHELIADVDHLIDQATWSAEFERSDLDGYLEQVAR
jgi:hypothetical protein